MEGGAKSLGKEGAGKGLGRGKRRSSWERWWREGCGEVFCNGCGAAVCEGCGKASCDGCSGSLSDNSCDTCRTQSECDTCRTQSECDTCVNSSGCDSDDLWICFKSKLNNHKAGRNFDGEKAVSKARVKKIDSAKITNPMAVKETMVSRKGGTERSTRTVEPSDIVPTSSRGSSKKTKLNNQKAGQNFDGGKAVTRSMAKKINSAQITNHIAVEKEMTSIKGGTKRTIRTVMKGEHHENDRQAGIESM